MKLGKEILGTAKKNENWQNYFLKNIWYRLQNLNIFISYDSEAQPQEYKQLEFVPACIKKSDTVVIDALFRTII